MWETAVTQTESLAVAQTTEVRTPLNEIEFHAFYARTARPLWAYLSRVSGDASLADDLLQESYYRFLRASPKKMDDAGQKSYLFRIATNLLRDRWRRSQGEHLPLVEMLRGENTADGVEQQSDLAGLLRCLKPRERELLWLAYVEGFNHKEIAEAIGLKAESIRLLLFRARQKLASLLRKGGFGDRERRR